MQIQHNIMAMNAYRNYASNTSALSKNLEKLSSGYKINRAGDDAAGLAISEKMRAQVTGLQTAQDNASSGINLVQTAEGSMTEVHDMLNRMVELADQSANGTYDNTTDRANLQKEVGQLKSEINRIADSSNFNGIKLLDGSLGGHDVTGTAVTNGVTSMEVVGGDFNGTDTIAAQLSTAGGVTTATITPSSTPTGVTWALVGDGITGTDGGTLTYQAVIGSTASVADQDAWEGTTITLSVDKANAGAYDTADSFTGTPSAGVNGLKLQIGDTSDSYNQLTVSVGDMHASSLGLDNVDISTQTQAADSVTWIKSAINKVSSTRGTLGATQNRLEHTINNLSTMTENIQDAESNIRDTDVAEEMMSYTKNNILVQSAQAMLAQANQVPQGVLQLLQ